MKKTNIFTTGKTALTFALLFGAFLFSPAVPVSADTEYESFDYDENETENGQEEFDENGIKYETDKNGTVTDTSQGLTYKYIQKTDSYSLSGAQPLKSSVTVPDRIRGRKVTELKKYAFCGTGIKKADIGKFVTKVGEGCFQDCRSLTKATFKGKITKIPNYCFYNSGLKTMELPSSVSKIGYEAFAGCRSLYRVTLPASLKEMDDTAFYKSSRVTYVAPRFSAPYKQLTQKGEQKLSSSKKLGFTIHSQLMAAGECKQASALNYDGKLKWKSSDSAVLKVSESGMLQALKPGSARLSAKGDSQEFSFRINVLPRTSANVMKVITSEYVRPEMTDFEKAAAAHAYLIRNVKYDYANYKNHSIPDADYTADGALVNGTAVCQGYALAFKKIMEHYKIPCVYVTNHDHGWNAVKIGGNYYHCDVTFDDPIIDGSNKNTEVHTRYFLIPDKKLTKHAGYNFHCHADNSAVDLKYRTTSAATAKSAPCALMPYLNASKVTLVKGGSAFQLKLSGTKAVSYSSDSSAVSVSRAGKVRAKSKGSATVRVKGSDGNTYLCSVKAETPRLSDTELELEKKESAGLKVSGTKKKATWRSSDPTIAKVDKNGKVRAVSKGQAEVTAEAGGRILSCKVTVTEPEKDSTDEEDESGSKDSINETWIPSGRPDSIPAQDETEQNGKGQDENEPYTPEIIAINESWDYAQDESDTGENEPYIPEYTAINESWDYPQNSDKGTDISLGDVYHAYMQTGAGQDKKTVSISEDVNRTQTQTGAEQDMENPPDDDSIRKDYIDAFFRGRAD